MRNTFRVCGLVYECRENYTYESELESENDRDEEYHDLPFASNDESTVSEQIENVL